jgi:hypothetical protein
MGIDTSMLVWDSMTGLASRLVWAATVKVPARLTRLETSAWASDDARDGLMSSGDATENAIDNAIRPEVLACE